MVRLCRLPTSRSLPTRCKFIAFMPQWDFLNFLSTHAKQFPSFQLLMEHEVVDLTFDQRTRDRRAGEDSRRRTGNSRRPDHRRRRTAFDHPGARWAGATGVWRRDRCALDADLKEAGRSAAITRLLSTRQIARVTRPRRLLAVRLRNSQRRLR